MLGGFTGRNKIAKFEGGFHGTHDAVQISDSPTLESAGPADNPCPVASLRGMSSSAINECIVMPYHDKTVVERLIVENCDDLACVLLDPKAGILPIRPDFVQFIRELTYEHGILLIADEIVGFRIGRGGMQEHFDIVPDLSLFGKLIGGGFRVGAFGGRAEIMDLLDNTGEPTGFFQSGTFSGHPVTLAAGLATLRKLTMVALNDLNKLGTRLKRALVDILIAKACLRKL